ncbi:MAG: hypothetical protein J5741_03425 [Bacteroidales bacterium]|nr:hypothetical protein [Bacteroidales bacterium]
MKRSAFILTMVSFVLILQAQEADTISLKTHAYHAVELDGLFNFNSNRFGAGIGIHEVYGKQFNPHLILGGGLSFDYLDYRGVEHFANYDEFFNVDEFFFRLYVNFRYIIMAKTKWSPLLMLSAGAICILDVPQSYRGCQPIQMSSDFGVFASFFAGVNYKLTEKHCLYGGFSYGMDVPLLTGFTFKLGVSF